MDIVKELSKGHSRTIALKIAKWAVKDKANMAELMKLFFGEDYRLTQRASWSVSLAYDINPEILKPHLKKMVKELSKPVHDAVKRNVLRILQTFEFPASLEGELVDVGFTLMANPKESIAVKTFAMTVVFRLLPKYPELKNEFKIIIEDQWPYASTAFKNRASKHLAKLT